jgi:hypothetical protein
MSSPILSISPPTAAAHGLALASRRQVLAGLAVAGAASLTPTAALGGNGPPVGVKDWLLDESRPPLQIPLDYLGLHSDHGTSHEVPPPTYPYDAVRSHDADNGHGGSATQWADVEVGPGVYDWRLTDAWFAANPGKTRIWVLFGCPAFYQKYPGEAFPFPALPGGGSPPRDPQSAANFVAALLRRYPAKIDFLEIWNEANFGPGLDPHRDRWSPVIGEPGWFTGTASELAEMARVVKGVLPPEVKLMAAGWAWQAKPDQLGPANSVLRFAAAPDGGGGFGRDHVQAISVHLYTYHNDPNARIEELRSYERLFDQCGYAKNLPRYVTEAGAWYPGQFTGSSPSLADKVRDVKRWCMIPAALGYRGVYLYKHSNLVTLGDPAKVPEIAAAIGDMRNGLRGRMLQRAAVLDDDTIWLSFSDGTELRA